MSRIFIFVAVYPEASPIIEAFKLKRDNLSGKIQVYKNDDGIILGITGVGAVSASAAVSYVLYMYDAHTDDYVFNIGTCCGKGDIYLVNKITDTASGRVYYPDMLIDFGIKESELKTYYIPATKSEDQVLIDMESSGVYQASSMFVGPHRMSFIKVVSDDGINSDVSITPAILTSSINSFIDVITEAIRKVREVDSLYSDDVNLPYDIDALCEEFKCSEYMRNDLLKYLRYSFLSNGESETNDVLNALRDSEILPAGNRKDGKEALNEFKSRIIK